MEPRIVSITGLRFPLILSTHFFLRGKKFSHTKVFDVQKSQRDFDLRRWSLNGHLLEGVTALHQKPKEYRSEFLAQKLLKIVESSTWNIREHAEEWLKDYDHLVMYNQGDWWICGEIELSHPSSHPLYQLVKDKLNQISSYDQYDLVLYLRIDVELIKKLSEGLTVSRPKKFTGSELSYIGKMIEVFDRKARDLKEKCLIIQVTIDHNPRILGEKVYELLKERGID